MIFVLGCCNNYNTPAVRALLRNNGADLSQVFQKLYRESSTYPRRSSANFMDMGGAQLAAEFHALSIFRHWFEFHGMKQDKRQHKADLHYTAIENANIISSVVGIEMSKPFGGFDIPKMLNALSNSTLFPDKTVLTLEKLSTQMIASVPVGFLNGYLV